ADVPVAAAGHHVLRHAGAGQAIELAVERELLGERLLRFGEEVMLASHGAELAVDDGLHQHVREMRDAAFGQAHSTNPRAFAMRRSPSCSTLRRSRSSRFTPGAPWRTSFSASAIACRSISASSSKFFVSTATKRAFTVASGAESVTTSFS